MLCGSNVVSNSLKQIRPYFFGVVYISPEYTKYSSEDAFSELQQEYLSFSNKSKYICFLVDFNARTATDTDFVDLIKNRHVDDYITDFVDKTTILVLFIFAHNFHFSV